MTRSRRRSPALALSVQVAGVVLIIAMAALIARLAPDWRWEHHPVHTLVEGAGAFAALTVAGLILLLRRFEEFPDRYIWIAGALIAMGILDGVHAATHAGTLFVWLHSSAQFAGGVLFLGILLPPMWTAHRMPWLPAGCLALSLAFVLVSLGAKEQLPAMHQDGAFTAVARFLNIAGGVGFFVAAAVMAVDPWRVEDEDRGLLSGHCLLFGVAGILFEWSVLWGGTWWFLHGTRLAAFGCVFAILFRRVYLIMGNLEVARSGLEGAIVAKSRELEVELEGRSARESKYMNLAAQLESRARESEELQLATLNIAEDAREAHERAEAASAHLRMANEQLDQFAYVASHDLRAPLRSITSLASWITEDAGEVLPEDSKRHLQTIKDRIVRMRALLDDLLEYSRVGRQKGELATVDSREIAERIVSLLGVPSGIRVDIERDLPTLHTFEVPFELVLRNLISNAVKHMDRESGNIRVSSVANGEYVHFTVEDDGPGIPEDCRERIFEIFQTLRPRDEVEGSGMGLALVQKTVEHEGGRVEVCDSELGGARFTFSWPKTSRAERESDDEGSYHPSGGR